MTVPAFRQLSATASSNASSGPTPARTRARGGAGLGLAIVKAITTAHGGDVRVGESALGGARFELTLPLDGTPKE